jgi:hypothetical protein
VAQALAASAARDKNKGFFMVFSLKVKSEDAFQR